MDSMNVALSESMREFVESRIANGGYGSVSEYVQNLILDDQKRMAPEALEAAILEGLNSGESTPMTPDDWDAIRREIRQVHRARQDK